jgi:hypothetical protein
MQKATLEHNLQSLGKDERLRFLNYFVFDTPKRPVDLYSAAAGS